MTDVTSADRIAVAIDAPSAVSSDLDETVLVKLGVASQASSLRTSVSLEGMRPSDV